MYNRIMDRRRNARLKMPRFYDFRQGIYCYILRMQNIYEKYIDKYSRIVIF